MLQVIHVLNTRYFQLNDVNRYIELLTEACNSITEPFGLKLMLPPLSSVSSLQSYPVIGEDCEGCEGITDC